MVAIAFCMSVLTELECSSDMQLEIFIPSSLPDVWIVDRLCFSSTRVIIFTQVSYIAIFPNLNLPWNIAPSHIEDRFSQHGHEYLVEPLSNFRFGHVLD